MAGSPPFGDRQITGSVVHDDDWLVGGGEMGQLIRSMDWSATPLGPLGNWPHSLRTTVSLCLSSNFPMNILWGAGSNQIYNDGYRVIVGEKHPAGMGMGYRECWESAWPQIGPPFERAWAGQTSFLENQRMFLTRSGYLEETFFTFSLSPIRDEHGRVAGLFHPVTETTAQMLSERRTRALRELAANTSEARTLEAAFKLCVETFAAHSLDLPFVLLYSMTGEGAEARLVASAGIEPGSPASPATIRPATGTGGSYPLAEMLGTESIVAIQDLKTRFGDFPCGPYPEGANLALARALRVPGVSAPLGIIVAGISPRLPFHQEYRDHVQQVVSGTATALANALAYERERKRVEEFAALDRAKTQFFSNISHEFRTPLTLILGPLDDALADTHALAPKLREQLALAQRNSLRLLRLVNSLLDFSRIEAGRVKAVYQPTDLSELTAELASNFRSATERAGLRLNIDCSPLAGQVYVDTEMWEKVVLNLLSNAFKFTFEGNIAVRLAPVEHGVELSVSDTGIGIPAHELPHLFERFHRVEGAHGRTHEGTGIGLALVQELVKLHGGTISVESTAGGGSTFRVRIPMGAAHLPPEQVGGAREHVSTTVRAEAFLAEALRWLPDGAPSVPLLIEATSKTLERATESRVDEPGGKVLVVDDNADMRDYARRLLAGRYEVLTATNGEEGLALALRSGPDLVLSDIMMPVSDGIDLLRALRSHHETSTIPVIFLSARAGEEARSEGMDAGADDYLVKPFSARELLARVGAHLRLARTRKEAEQALRASEERLRALVTATSYAVYRMSPDWAEMRELEGQGFLSDTAEPITGWLQQYIVPDDQPIVLAEIQRAIRSKSLFELEHRVRRVDGSIGWTLSRAVPLVDTDGEITEWIGSASDVTARRHAEVALRASQERLQRVLETDTVGVLFFDYSGTVVAANSVFLKMTGYTAQEIERRELTWRRMTPDEWVPESESQMRRLAETGWMGPYEKEYILKDGSRRWILLAGRDLGDGTISEYCIDISARRQAEARLRESEERFRLMVENVKEYALFQTDPDGRVTSWNPGAERLFGYSGSEMVGRHAAALLTPEDQRAGVPDREIARVRAGEHAQDARWMVRKDGSRFWAQWVTEPVHDEGGQLRGVAKVLRDETERKRAGEQQLLLMGELNHRVKNTLATVQSMANQTLQGNPNPEEFVSRFKGRIQALSRAHGLLTRVSWEAAEVAEIIREQLTLDGDAERIELQGVPAVLPAASSLALALVLHELGTNARKYGALSGSEGRVTVTWRIVHENGEAALHLNWCEQGGPPVESPGKVGFGTTLIEHGLRGVGGQTRLEFVRPGLHCRIQLPLAGRDDKTDQQRRPAALDR